jgi:hypothetical protein
MTDPSSEVSFMPFFFRMCVSRNGNGSLHDFVGGGGGACAQSPHPKICEIGTK